LKIDWLKENETPLLSFWRPSNQDGRRISTRRFATRLPEMGPQLAGNEGLVGEASSNLLLGDRAFPYDLPFFTAQAHNC
jgi:hypothetical protein